jgi:hypothetical protein
MYLVHQLISIIQLMESFRVWPKVILLSGIYHTVLILRGRCSASATVCGNLRIPTLKASENVETQLKQNNFFLTWSIFCCCMYHKRFCVTVRNAGSKCNNEREDKKQWLDSNGFAFCRLAELCWSCKHFFAFNGFIWRRRWFIIVLWDECNSVFRL